MFKKALQKLHEELDRLEKSQKEHLLFLTRKIETQKQRMDCIERTVIGYPDDANNDITNYIDKHGF